MSIFALLIWLIVLGVVVALVYFVTDTLAIPEPINRIIKVVTVVVACILIIGVLLDAIGMGIGIPKLTHRRRVMPRAKEVPEGKAVPVEKTPEEIGTLCSNVVAKYAKPNVNARTMLSMPEFWADITFALRGESVEGIMPEPVLDSIDPEEVELNSADITLRCLGSGFTPESKIIFAEVEEPIVFVSENEITTIVKPSLGWGAVDVTVAVKNDQVYSDPLTFTFTEPPVTRTTEEEDTEEESKDEETKTRRRSKRY